MNRRATVPVLWELALQFGDVVRVCIPHYGPPDTSEEQHGRNFLIEAKPHPIRVESAAESACAATEPIRRSRKRKRSYDSSGSDMDTCDVENRGYRPEQARGPVPDEPVHAFVEFESLQQAKYAKYAMNQLMLYGRRLQTRLAHTRDLLSVCAGHVFVRYVLQSVR